MQKTGGKKQKRNALLMDAQNMLLMEGLHYDIVGRS